MLCAAQRVMWTDDEREAVRIDGDGAELRRVRTKGDDAHFKRAQVQFLRDTGSQRPVHGDVDLGKLATELVESWKQNHAGVLIGGQLQAPALEAFQFAEGAGCLAAQREQADGVFAQKRAGGGEGTVARGAVEKKLAQGFFELADHLADRRLGAMKAHGGAREAALFGYGEEGFKLIEVHRQWPV